MPVTLPGSPRIYARSLRAWVLSEPRPNAPQLGYLRLGASAPTRGPSAGVEKCPGGWYPIQPTGFVCVGEDITLNGSDPVVRATADLLPDITRKLPYIYGTVRKPGPIYQRLPTPNELQESEPDLDRRMQEWLSAPGEVGASYGQEVWLGGVGDVPDPRDAWATHRSDALPPFLRDGASTPTPGRMGRSTELVVDRMGARVGYSFLRTLLWQGRRYGVATDLRVLPTDRLRPIRGSEHHGVRIGVDIDFPFALVRREDARFWRKDKGGIREAGIAPYFSAVKLTGKQSFLRGKLHYETADGNWISDRDAARIEPAKRMPRWGKDGERWIDVSITHQRLVLYDGTSPVFATLISSGEAGLEEAEGSTATKRGIFRIHTKHLSITMDSREVGEEFELRDVPYVQYFDQGGYALHGAYWHDRFGTPKSHGCINLTPEDARRVFFFTEPSLPIGWHGVLLPLRGTTLFIHP